MEAGGGGGRKDGAQGRMILRVGHPLGRSGEASQRDAGLYRMWCGVVWTQMLRALICIPSEFESVSANRRSQQFISSSPFYTQGRGSYNNSLTYWLYVGNHFYYLGFNSYSNKQGIAELDNQGDQEGQLIIKNFHPGQNAIISELLWVRNPGMTLLGPLFHGLCWGCNQSVSQNWGLLWKLNWERLYMVLSTWDCWKVQQFLWPVGLRALLPWCMWVRRCLQFLATWASLI